MYAYRYHHAPNLSGDYGYHLWTRNIAKTGTHYGPYLFRLDITNTLHINNFVNDIVTLLTKDYANGQLPASLDDIFNYGTTDDIARELNPDNIINSGEAWDNPDLVSWMYDRYFDERDIYIIATDDGAISFLPDDPHIEYIGN